MAESILKFYVPDLHCGGCVKRFTAAMDKGKTQQEYEFQCDPLKRQVMFESESVKSIQDLKKQMYEAGFPAYIMLDSKQVYLKEQRDFLKRIFVSVMGMMQVMMFAVAIYMEEDMPSSWMGVFHWFSLFVTTPVLLYAGKPYFLSAANALMRKQVNMEVPVSIALVIAYVYSFIGLIQGVHTLYFDSINMFLFLLTLGRYAEWKARFKTVEASEALWADIPQKVTVITEEGDIEKELTQVRPKDIVLVKVGAQLPVDGEIVSGQSLIDESMLTGESEPVLRQPGHEVFAGTVNQTQSITVRAKAVQGATQLGHIQRLLFEAQEAKPAMARYADKVAGYFIVRLIILSVVVGGFWWWYDAPQAIPIVVSLLIVTCPCALSLATPAAIAAALARLTQQGVVVAKGDALEKAGEISHFIFDKTGTLTEGAFEIGDIRLFDLVYENNASENEVLKIASALEATTEHPIGKAFAGVSKAHGSHSLVTATNIQVLPGVGIQGEYEGQAYVIGAPDIVLRQIEAEGVEDHVLQDIKRQLQSNINSNINATQLMLIAKPARPLALISLKSKVRQDAAEVIRQIHPHGVSLLSGDHESAVSSVATALGISAWQSRATPESKQRSIQELQKTEKVLMVGDGVNDGPVLAQADIGIAMGYGTALAKSSADVILIHDRLKDLHVFLKMAKATRKIIRENMAWAVVYNLIAIPFAAAGLVPPWLAAIGMSASSLLVVLNSLRLLKWQDKKQL